MSGHSTVREPTPRAPHGEPLSGGEPRLRLEPLIAFAIGAIGMTIVQTGAAAASGNDSYYHLRMATLLPQVGFIREFPWLHWTIFRDDFVSHHHGFHVLLMPFAMLSERLTGDAVPGGKVLSIACMGATAAAAWLVLREMRVRYSWLWVLALWCAPWHFWLRLSYIRAPIAAMPMLLLAAWMILRFREDHASSGIVPGRRSDGTQGRAVWAWMLGGLAFLFTHLYGGAVLFPLVPLAFLGGDLLTGFAGRRSLVPLGASIAGVVAGLVINPYFPGNLAFLRTQLFQTGLGAVAELEVGREWYPFDTWFFLFHQCVPYTALMTICVIRRITAGAPVNSRGVGLLLLNVGFLILTMKAKRFVEYWPAFALLNMADLGAVERDLPIGMNDGSRSAAIPTRGRSDSFVGWMFNSPVELAVALLAVGGFTLWLTRLNVPTKLNQVELRAALETAAATSNKGDLILTDDWDIFPYCFYYNQHNTYAVGLDPVFTQRQYPALWERYRIITRGQAPGRVRAEALQREKELNEELTGPAARRRVTLENIADAFQAKFVLVVDDHPDFYEQLRARPEQFPRLYPPVAQPNAGSEGSVRPAAEPGPNVEARQPAVAVFRVLPPPSAATEPADRENP